MKLDYHYMIKWIIKLCIGHYDVNAMAKLAATFSKLMALAKIFKMVKVLKYK